jgi:hypothetical protein
MMAREMTGGRCGDFARSALSLVLVAPLLVVLTSCSSTATKVERFLDGGYYEEARAFLEGKGAGASLSSGVSDRALEARAAFEARIWADFGAPAVEQVQIGLPRAAQQGLSRGIELCPWSPRLTEAHRENVDLIDRLDQLEVDWASDEVDGIESARAAIGDISDARDRLRDTPVVEQAWESAWLFVAEWWADALR